MYITCIQLTILWAKTIYWFYTHVSLQVYMCTVYRAEMADHLRTLPNLFDYFPGLGDDVRPCVTHHPRHLHAVPSGSVQQNMELLFNIQHIIRLLFNAQNKFNNCETKLKFMHTPYIYVHASAKKYTVVCQSSIYMASIHYLQYMNMYFY